MAVVVVVSYQLTLLLQAGLLTKLLLVVALMEFQIQSMLIAQTTKRVTRPSILCKLAEAEARGLIQALYVVIKMAAPDRVVAYQ